MVFIYWKRENLENLATLFAFPSRTSTSPVGWSPNHRLQSSFFLCYFPLICNTSSPKLSGLGRHHTRFKLPKFLLLLVHLAQESKGKRRRTQLCFFFHARQGSVPRWPIPAVSPHPNRIPSGCQRGPWPPSSVHSTGSSTSHQSPSSSPGRKNLVRSCE